MLGPLHTPPKSRGHEIVRAQKKVSEGRPTTTSKITLCDHKSSSVV
jgi:hypothetical protein